MYIRPSVVEGIIYIHFPETAILLFLAIIEMKNETGVPFNEKHRFRFAM